MRFHLGVREGEGAVVSKDPLARPVRTWNRSTRVEDYALWSMEYSLSDEPTPDEVLKRPDLDPWQGTHARRNPGDSCTRGVGAGWSSSRQGGNCVPMGFYSQAQF